MCGAELRGPYLDLGEQPYANALRIKAQLADAEPTAPLAIMWCPSCTLSQLNVVVNPEALYGGYRFRAGVSPLWRQHIADLAETRRADHILDLAANDGTLLRAYAAVGASVLGVDPAPACDDLPMIAASWSADVARLVHGLHEPFDLITATNVLGHVDDPVAFLLACHDVLASDGRVLVEVPYVGALLAGLQFDTIYHEHLSYWSVTAMREVAHRADFYVDSADWLPNIHGGSVRYILRAGAERRPTTWLERAPDLDRYETYEAFGAAVTDLLERTRKLLHGVLDYQEIIGYGAAAKGAVTLNALPDIAKRMRGVVDDTPEKQHLYMPGIALPVLAPDNIIWPDAEFLWLLSWNNADALKLNAYNRRFRGHFFTMLPKPKVTPA